jgi:hypothetical protein
MAVERHVHCTCHIHQQRFTAHTARSAQRCEVLGSAKVICLAHSGCMYQLVFHKQDQCHTLVFAIAYSLCVVCI